MHDALRLAESVLFVDVLRRRWLNFSGFHSAGNHRNPRSNVNDKCNHTTHVRQSRTLILRFDVQP